MSSELYSELYENGDIGGYGASWYVEGGHSYLNIYGDSDDPEAVFKKFTDYVERCVREGISEEAFVRARRVLYARAVRSFESTSDIAEELFSGFISDGDIFDMTDAIYKVEKSELDSIVRDVFRPERYAMCVVLPTEENK